MNETLCNTCAKADVSCPIYPTDTTTCVEYVTPMQDCHPCVTSLWHYEFARCPSAGTHGPWTTVHKHVTCPDCLAAMGPDPEQLNGYHFPATRFASVNLPSLQMLHIHSELREFLNATSVEHEVEEAIDLLHSVETYLRIRAKEGVDIAAAKLAVYQKNRVRGYYG